MPTLDIDGQKITVGDDFLKLSPEQQNATVDEIAGKINVAPKATAVELAKDIGKSLVGGAIEGSQFIPDITNMGQAGIDWLTDKALGTTPEYQKAREASRFKWGSKEAVELAERAVGPLGAKATETPTGQVIGPYLESAAKFAVPSALTGGGLIGGGAVPGLMSEAGGQLYKDTPYENMARVGGGLAGNVVGPSLQRAVTPFPARPEREALAQQLMKEGVPLSAGQRTGSLPLRWAEESGKDTPLAAARAEKLGTATKEAYTSAALKRVGETAARATPEVIDRAFTRIGQQFDDLAARNTLQADRQLGQDLVDVEKQYHRYVNPSQRAPVIENTIREVGDAIATNGGVLPGDIYQATRSELGRGARSAGTDNKLRDALYGLQRSLDDAMERNITASGRPEDIAAWKTARNEYRNMLVLEKATTGAGSETAEGLISPSQLRNAVVNQDRRSYARGQGDYADLARSGEAILKPLPNSGTGARMSWMNVTPGVQTIRAALSRALLSTPAQAYLGNQLAAPAARGRLIRGLIDVPVSSEKD